MSYFDTVLTPVWVWTPAALSAIHCWQLELKPAPAWFPWFPAWVPAWWAGSAWCDPLDISCGPCCCLRMDWGRPQLAEQFGTAQIPFPPETISIWILLKSLIYRMSLFVLSKLTVSICFLMPLAYHTPIQKMLKFEVWILRNFDFHYIFQLLKTVKFYWLKVFFIIFFQFCAVEKRSKWILCNIRYSNFSISKFTGWHAFWGETMDSRFFFV